MKTYARISLAALASLAGTLALSPASAQTAQWRAYGNARYEYSICYPATLLAPQPEAQNGDGRWFRATDGAAMQVWGTPNTSNLSAAQVLARENSRIVREGGQVTYRATKANWYALSGRKGSQIFYQRGLTNGVRFATFRLSYPATAAQRWNPISSRISSCLHGAEEENSRPRAAAAAGAAVEPTQYIGLYPTDKLATGLAFLDLPSVRQAVTRVVSDPAIRRWVLDERNNQTPRIWRMNGNIVAAGCDPKACDAHKWAIVLDPRTKAARVCYGDYPGRLRTRWFSNSGVQNVGAETCPSGEDEG